MPRIELFRPELQNAAVQHILNIENNEFNLNLTLDEQPDLFDISSAYQKSGGQFWIATEKSVVLGTAGLFNLGGGDADLRKMFVIPEHRGGKAALGQKMLDKVIQWAVEHNYNRIFLETSSIFTAAICFYVKNGFNVITSDQLPSSFPIIRVAEKFFVKDIKNGSPAIL